MSDNLMHIYYIATQYITMYPRLYILIMHTYRVDWPLCNNSTGARSDTVSGARVSELVPPPRVYLHPIVALPSLSS